MNAEANHGKAPLPTFIQTVVDEVEYLIRMTNVVLERPMPIPDFLLSLQENGYLTAGKIHLANLVGCFLDKVADDLLNLFF